MRQYTPLIALGLGAWLAFLISTFPAETALRWFAPANLRVSNVSGTVWSGSAELASIDQFALADLNWNVRALPLLLARVSGTGDARLSNGFVDTGFSLSGSSVELRELQLSTTVATLGAVLPVSGASGALSAQFSELALEQVELPGAGIVFWPVRALGSVRVSDLMVEPYAGLGNQLIPLGNFEMDFAESTAEALAAQIRDRGGPLEFNGSLRLTPSLEYELEGQVATRDNAAQSLVQGLNFMAGEPGPDGMRTLSLAGSL